MIELETIPASLEMGGPEGEAKSVRLVWYLGGVCLIFWAICIGFFLI